MKAKDQVFIKYEDESGRAYYCTINAVADNNIVSDWDIDSCEEAPSDRRYIGKPNLVDRNE